MRPVIVEPDPVLSRAAAAIGALSDAARSLAVDLVDTMYASPACVGLAAPQIGVPLRAFALDVGGHKLAGANHGRIVMFDPVVAERSGSEVAREGCMSVPHLTCDVSRAGAVVVRGLGVDGQSLTIEAVGFEARAIQHEIDHLDGMLIIDRATGPRGIFPRKIYR